MLEDGMEKAWRFSALSADPPAIIRFDRFEIDAGRFELRENGGAKHVEPQVLSLLILLARNPGRLIGKDEIIETVWNGRIVSEAAVASRIKSAREALGDDGKQQRFIRTVHGRGFRFMGTTDPAAVAPAAEPPRAERPSIAVIPFRLVGAPGPLSFAAQALADELIGDLSRLRWLMVIARASTFRFRDQEVGCDAIGAALGVRYCVTGTLEDAGNRVILSVELARTGDCGLVWSERFEAGAAELQGLRRELATRIVAQLESHLMQEEVALARRATDASLSAWSAYHLGLDHMFRFSKADNVRAAALFTRALALDPHFSRALSGLSFTCFQDCFLRYSGERDAMAQRARTLAEQALHCDPLDPFAHLNLGRALWLEDGVAQSIDRLSDCITLSPSHAQAVYSRAWAEMTQGEHRRSDADAALALRLSPLDPLRYAMQAVQAVNALLSGDSERAALLGETAARSPGAHKHIAIIAAITARAAGRSGQAAQWTARARQMDADVDAAGFLQSFPFAPSRGRETIERLLREARL